MQELHPAEQRQRFSKHNLQKYFQEKNPEPIIFAPFSRGHHNMDDGGCMKILDLVQSKACATLVYSIATLLVSFISIFLFNKL